MWAAALQPSGVPQPSWSGAIAHPKEWATLWLTHFAAIRRRVVPTAMGRYINCIGITVKCYWKCCVHMGREGASGPAIHHQAVIEEKDMGNS